MNALTKLKKLEQAIYDAGVDGGMATSYAIEELYIEEKRLGVHTLTNSSPRWQEPSEEDRTEVCKAEARATPAGQLLQRMGMDYWDTESTARRVAEKAAEEIDEVVAAFKLFIEYYDDLAESNGPGFIGNMCLQDYARMNEAYLAVDRLNIRNR